MLSSPSSGEGKELEERHNRGVGRGQGSLHDITFKCFVIPLPTRPEQEQQQQRQQVLLATSYRAGGQAKWAEERDKLSFVIRAMYTYICTWITNWLGATITHFIDSKSMCLHDAHFIRFTVDSRLGHAGVYVMWNSYSSHGSLMLNLCLLPISFTLESAVRE